MAAGGPGEAPPGESPLSPLQAPSEASSPSSVTNDSHLLVIQ